MKRKRTIITSRAAAARTPKRALRDAAARTRATAAAKNPSARPAVKAAPTPAPEPRGPVDVDLRVDLAPTRRGSLILRTPIVVASGVLGYGAEAAESLELDRIGAIVTRTTTRGSRSGNAPLRMVEVASGGVVHSIGFQNPGVVAVLDRFSGRWSNLGTPVIVSIAAESALGFGELAEALDGQPGVAGIELNLSCPELARGQDFALDEDAADRATSSARERTDLPLIVKLSAAASDIRSIAIAVVEAGADAISCSNGMPASAIDLLGRTRSPSQPARYATLSGPPIRAISLRAVSEIAQAVRVPIIGTGGVTSLDDVLDYVAAGASAVAVGSAVFADPTLPSRLALELERYLYDQGVATIAEIRGSALARRRRPSSPKVRASSSE
jgi:dihydroorotate dehydrogenase (NAD+) catalytic subunit